MTKRGSPGLMLTKNVTLFLMKILLLLLVSCNFKPNYSRPDMAMPESWRFNIEGETTDYVNAAWWEQFYDPLLDDFIREALENNQDLQVATARVLEFFAQFKIVASSLYPEVDLNASYMRQDLTNGLDYSPIPTGTRVNNLYALFLSLSYEIDFWGAIRNATDAAKSEYFAQIETRRTVILTLVSSLASAYILLEQYDKQLQISQMTYASRLDSWRLAKLRFEGGLTSELEVMQAESEADDAEIQVKTYEELIPQQEDLICVLLGRVPGHIDRGTLLTAPPSIPAGLPSDLLESRPDIVAAEFRLLAANAEIGVAKAAFFPTISLTGAFGFESTALSNFFSNAAKMWDVGVNALQAIFTGWKLTYQLKEAQAVALEAVHAYQQTILTAFQEVSDALIGHQKAKEISLVQIDQVQALTEYLKLATLRYDNGQNDYLTVLDAERSLFRAQLSQAETDANVFLTLVTLYKALGQGWDVEETMNDE